MLGHTPERMFTAYFFDEPLKTVLVYVGLTPIAITCLGFGYFAIVNPDKLQSEEYQIRHEAMQVLQVKSGSIEVSAASLNEIAGTVVRQLENVNEEEK